jgi:hypothetical protein
MRNRIKYNKDFFSRGLILKNLFSLNPANMEINLLPFESRMGLKPDKDITYKMNEYGLRSDSFKKDHKGLHILFAGDSSVEGSSNKIEDIWTSILYNKIKKQKEVSGYYSVGLGGLGIPTIIQQVLIYIEEYGKPDCLFIMYPDFFRYFKWDKETKRWKFTVSAETLDGHALKGDDDKHAIVWAKLFTTNEVSEEEELNILINQILLLKIFESFCKIMDIKYVWSTWDKINEKSLLESEVFENLISVMDEKELNDYFETHPDEPQMARDNFHHGIAYNKFWAEKYYDKYIQLNSRADIQGYPI